jgi:hypothetical protein
MARLPGLPGSALTPLSSSLLLDISRLIERLGFDGGRLQQFLPTLNLINRASSSLMS